MAAQSVRDGQPGTADPAVPMQNLASTGGRVGTDIAPYVCSQVLGHHLNVHTNRPQTGTGGDAASKPKAE